MAIIDIFYDVYPTFKSEIKYFIEETKKTPSMAELNEVVIKVSEEIREFPNIKRRLKNVESGIIEDLFAKMAREVKSSIVTTNEPGSVIRKKIEPSWITSQRIDDDSWNYWKRYVEYLKVQGRPDSTIHELEKSTLTVLELLGDPLIPELFRKGLVVGNVQSGKTSNFNGVINRAIDSGYKLIIVFSGIMDDLRTQTQDRIEKDILGWGTIYSDSGIQNGVKGVGKIREFGNEGVRQIESITSMQTDFSRSLLDANFSFANPKILVCKKNHNVLANLIYWIYTSLPSGKAQMGIPLLVLDDEADNASLNNLGFKGEQYATKINGHIRALLNLFSRKSYLGYTATPFANILQDQQKTFIGSWKIKYRVNGQVLEIPFGLTQSLFPEDFIYKLNPPSNYIGPKLIFENGKEQEGEKKLPLVVVIDDFQQYFPEKAKRNVEIPEGLPDSLTDAIDCFILSIALRLSRENLIINSPSFNPHHSMLVHVSNYTNWQNETSDKIHKYLEDISKKIKLNGLEDPLGIYSHYEKQWNRYFAYEVENFRSFLPSDYFDPTLIPKYYKQDIRTLLPKAIEGIEVKAVNSDRKESLNYNTTLGRGKKYIAVGGNRLSRGFTLEGLTINYFLRDSSYYDALLQMGRWFGYRIGYADACRLFISKTTRENYNFITKTLTELEELFEVMNSQFPRRTPKDFELRIRKHHDALKITRPSILKNAKEIKFSFQDETIETYKFLLDDNKLKQAWQQFQNLITSYKDANNFNEDSNNGFQVIKTDLEGLQKFLSIEKLFTSTSSFVLEDLIKYINLANSKGYLKNWLIAVQKTGTGALINNGPLKQFSLSKRSGPIKEDGGQETNTFYNDLKDYNIFSAGGGSARLITAGKDEAVGLSPQSYEQAVDEFRRVQTKKIMDSEGLLEKEASKKAEKKTLPGYIFRRKRSSFEGLMLVYLLDIKYVLQDEELRSKISSEALENNIPLIGYAFSLPVIENDPGGEYMANEVSEEDFGNPVADELETIRENPEDPVIL